MHQEEFQKILRRYNKGLCTPEEETLVENWFRAMGSSDEPPLSDSDKTEIRQRSWTKVQEHILHVRKEKADQHMRERVFSINTVPSLSIAAAILVVLVSMVFLMVTYRQESRQASTPALKEKSISNHTGEVMKVSLSDGSTILLEPNSSVSFKEPFEGNERLVCLEGAAFFTVSKNASRPFLVNTKEVITKVLGTSFTVSAFPDDDNITVSVMTGKVSVMTRQAKESSTSQLNETILTPNQKIVYNKKENLVSRAIVSKPVPIISFDALKRMQFEAAPIAEIFNGLEEVYGVDIEFDEEVFASCILTTSIGYGDIYNRLEMICKAIDAQYALKENVIVITGHGCSQ